MPRNRRNSEKAVDRRNLASIMSAEGQPMTPR
jgi:hypothetical protein